MKIRHHYSQLSVSIKLLSPLLAAFLTIWSMGVIGFGLAVRNHIEQDTQKDIAHLTNSLQKDFRQRQELLNFKARIAITNNQIIQAIASGDRNAILRTMLPLQSSLELDLIKIIDPNGQTLLSLKQEKLQQANLDDRSIDLSARAGLELSGILTATNHAPSAMVELIPIKSNQKVLGGLVLGIAIDDQLLKTVRGKNMHLVTLQNNWITASTLTLDHNQPLNFPAVGFSSYLTIAKEKYFVKTIELSSFDSATLPVSILYSLQESEKAEREMWLLAISFGLLGGILVSGVTIGGFILTQSLSQRIQNLTQFTQELAAGNLDVTIPIDTQDELGVLAQGFNSMAQELRAKDQYLKLQMRQLEYTLIELHDSQQLGQLVMENIPLAIFWKDRNLNYLGCNQYFANIAGLASPNDIVGKSDYDLPWTKEESDWYREWDSQIMANDVSELGIIESQRRADGKDTWLETNKVTLHNAIGEVTGILGVFQDITDRRDAEIMLWQMNEELELRVTERTKELEAAKQIADFANQAKSEFLASMSHELRTPLNGILGYTQILKRSPVLPDQEKHKVEVIHQCASHLLSLINDILDLAKIEANKLEINPKAIHLPSFLQSVVDICQVRADEKELAFVYEPDPLLPNGVLADEKRLRQVLLNLLSNAIKFTDYGSVVFKVQLIGMLPSPLVHFKISDTGVGIDFHQIHQIFQVFEQVGDQHKQSEGTGLGLSISQKIVQMMGGEIQVNSTVGQGSEFFFSVRLPLIAPTTEITNNLDRKSYNSSDSSAPRPLEITPEQIIAPPIADLKILLELSQNGLLKRLIATANGLSEQNILYQPFAQQVIQLAKNFQSEKIDVFIQHHLTHAHNESN